VRLGRAQHASEASFDLTPMIDVVFLLIIFFTLTAQFSAISLAPLDLPKERGEEHGAKKPLTMYVDVKANGSLSAGGVPMSLSDLGRDIARHVQTAGTAEGLDLIVRAERSTPAVEIDRVVTVLSNAGVRKWKLATSGESHPTESAVPR
jgi:biopolymer transport protein ExbD